MQHNVHIIEKAVTDHIHFASATLLRRAAPVLLLRARPTTAANGVGVVARGMSMCLLHPTPYSCLFHSLFGRYPALLCGQGSKGNSQGSKLSQLPSYALFERVKLFATVTGWQCTTVVLSVRSEDASVLQRISRLLKV